MASTSREVINCPSLSGTSEAALYQVLGPRVQEGCGETEEGSEEGYQECQGLEYVSRRRD